MRFPLLLLAELATYDSYDATVAHCLITFSFPRHLLQLKASSSNGTRSKHVTTSPVVQLIVVAIVVGSWQVSLMFIWMIPLPAGLTVPFAQACQPRVRQAHCGRGRKALSRRIALQTCPSPCQGRQLDTNSTGTYPTCICHVPKSGQLSRNSTLLPCTELYE